MIAEELKTALQAYYNDQANIGVCVYALMKDAESPGPRPLHNLADHPAEARIMLILSRFA